MKTIPLQAGPVTLHLSPETGTVRWIRAGDHELLRGIGTPVRNANWDTVPTQRVRYELRRTARGFRAVIGITGALGDVDFTATTTVTGDATGKITLVWEARARSAFRYNRAGVCLLHPPSAAGHRCRIDHNDGTRREGRFPVEISPHQPFTDIRAITTELEPGIDVEVRAEGDVWEMEDQRNWLDASYKTYCTPLRLPFPFDAKKGQRFKHRITVRLLRPRGWKPAPVADADAAVVLRADPSYPARTFALGLNWSEGDDQPLSAKERGWLRAARPDHLRIDVDPADPARLAVAEAGIGEAVAAAIPLEIALHAGAGVEADLRAWLTRFAARKPAPAVARWIVYDRKAKSVTSAALPEAVRSLLRGAGTPVAPVVSGTNCYFAELNRGRPPATVLDGVAYSFNPQVHAFDEASLVETLSMVPVTVANAIRLARERPVILSPISLRPRFNPNATAAPVLRPGVLPDSVDPRQATAFGAAWTVGLLAALARSGAAGATLYGVRGWTGLFERKGGAPKVPGFLSKPGEPYPLFHVLVAVAAARSGGLEPLTTSDPARAEAVSWRAARGRHVLVANLGDTPLDLTLPGFGEAASLHPLVAGARGAPRVKALGAGLGVTVRLPAHATALLTFPTKN